MARRRRGFFRSAGRRIRRRARTIVRYVQPRTFMAKVEGFFGKLARRPSRVIAAALGIGGLINLLFTPLPDGDSWMSRLKQGFDNFQSSKNPMDLLADDGAGNNVISVLGIQMVNNVWTSLPMFAGAAIAGWVGRKFHV